MTCLTVGLEQLVENEAEEAKQYGKWEDGSGGQQNPLGRIHFVQTDC
jgi:hypothetical protein